MITVILKNKSGEEMGRASKPGNEAYLEQEGSTFPLLSEVDDYSPNLFGGTDVPQLLTELDLVAKSLLDPQSMDHVKEIAELVERAAHEEGAFILFTPFDINVRRRR